MDSAQVLEKYNELKQMVEALELDAHKNSRGVVVAGLRLRRGLRRIKVCASDLVKLTSVLDKAIKASKSNK